MQQSCSGWKSSSTIGGLRPERLFVQGGTIEALEITIGWGNCQSLYKLKERSYFWPRLRFWQSTCAELMTGVKVVDPCCEAAACNKVANCSGLYSLLGILGGTEGSLVTADMLGKRADMETGVAGELPEDWLRTSTMLWVETAGMG